MTVAICALLLKANHDYPLHHLKPILGRWEAVTCSVIDILKNASDSFLLLTFAGKEQVSLASFEASSLNFFTSQVSIQLCSAALPQ